MKSTKRSNNSQSNGKDSKKRKVENASESSTESLNFMKSLNVFILQAGIEKMRMNIFKTQLEKYGGDVKNELKDDVSHLVVDDKMEYSRMCRLLKISTPPTNICIVKSGWLSACFKNKSLIDTSEFILDCPKPDITNEVPETSTSSESKSDAAVKPEYPKVGVMFGHKTKTTHSDNEDSDYCPSGGESEPEADYSTSSSTTPSTSPKKNLPVSAQAFGTFFLNYLPLIVILFLMIKGR